MFSGKHCDSVHGVYAALREPAYVNYSQLRQKQDADNHRNSSGALKLCWYCLWTTWTQSTYSTLSLLSPRGHHTSSNTLREQVHNESNFYSFTVQLLHSGLTFLNPANTTRYYGQMTVIDLLNINLDWRLCCLAGKFAYRFCSRAPRNPGIKWVT